MVVCQATNRPLCVLILDVNKYIEENMANRVTNNGSNESEWGNCLKTLNASGENNILEVRKASYNRYAALLG